MKQTTLHLASNGGDDDCLKRCTLNTVLSVIDARYVLIVLVDVRKE